MSLGRKKQMVIPLSVVENSLKTKKTGQIFFDGGGGVTSFWDASVEILSPATWPWFMGSGSLTCPLCFPPARIWIVAEKAMAPHSSTLAWKIPWTEEPGRLQSMGSLRVRHDWATSLSRIGEMATQSSVIAWRIPGMGEPGGLPTMGLRRVRHDWSDLAAAAASCYPLDFPPNFNMASQFLFIWITRSLSQILST